MGLPLQTVAAVASASEPNRRDYGIGAPSGPAGRGVASMTYDSTSGMVTVTFSDLFTQQLGPVRGEPGLSGGKGDQGNDGPIGPAGPSGPLPWQAAQPWAPSTSYVSEPPASLATYAGGVYVCAVDHLSGAVFDASKWVLVAAPGSTWREGSIAPASSLGVDGDYYLNTSTGDVSYRSGGAYGVIINLIGPRGSTGPSTWQTPPTAWAANTAYGAVPPASTVSYAGSSYVCAIAHTSGANFDASKWALIAGQGSPGPQGNVGPSGPPAAYRWSGTSISFQNPDGTWGAYVNLANNPQGTSTVAGLDDGEFDNAGYQPAPATATAGSVDDGTY